MKQHSKKYAKINLIIAVALCTAIVIVAFFSLRYVRHSSTMAKLSALAEETRSADEALNHKYEKMDISDGVAPSRKAFRKAMNQIITEASKDTLKSLDEVKEILGEVPREYTQIVADDSIYSLLFGEVKNGREAFDSFIFDTRLGHPSELIMVQFTINLDPIYYYIEYDGKKYHIVEDQTSDGYTGDNAYIENTARYVRFEGYVEKSGDITEYGYSTDNYQLRYNDVLNSLEDESKISAGNDCWQFYISTLEKDKIEDRMIPVDRIDKDFKAAYTGFADIHPDFAKNNPMKDYDDDGTIDRVYRECRESKYGSIVNTYLLLGNGNTIYLASNLWGEDFSTPMKDEDCDGHKDIVFTQYTENEPDKEPETRVFEYRNGNYVLKSEG